jgi:hypothetical protein
MQANVDPKKAFKAAFRYYRLYGRQAIYDHVPDHLVTEMKKLFAYRNDPLQARTSNFCNSHKPGTKLLHNCQLYPAR